VEVLKEAGTSASRNLDHVICRYRQTGHESAIAGNSSLSIGDGDSQPVDVQRFFTVA
jgi:hypothetical protein